jgi:hypothetical protein
MRFFRYFFILSLFLTVFYLPVSAQNNNDVLDQLLAKSTKAYISLPVEKVYLHFDKPYYAVGDTIWFKAYLTIGIHQPSLLSNIIYVDLLSGRDSLVQAVKLQVKNGVAWGNIPLIQTAYKKGNYRIVAYTNYMNNVGVAYFFNKNITIGDAINNPLSAQISLKTTTAGKSSKISASIFYKDNDGVPFAEKRVSWSVERDDESIAKGKGITDKNGFIDISFVNTKNLSLDSANLVTEIEDRQQKQIGNSFSLKTISKPNDIQFFPEGGQLITGVRTKIAFKAIKPDGLGIEVKGTITDNNNNLVTDFASSHLGMGVFILVPEEGKTYTAHVTYADGTIATPVFPKIGSDGIDLGVDSSKPDTLNIKLQADEAFMKDFQDKTFFILAKSSGAICFAAKLQLSGPIYNASIPKSKFPTGIVQLTLFTEDGEPVSERIAFIQHNDQLNLSVKSDQPGYETRQLVKLKLNSKYSGQPDEGNFSVSVIDESKVPFDEDAETTIFTNLLLTSDIAGFIEKPNYYFNNMDQKKLADLDILLQTQGYRRYSYDDIINNKPRTISHSVEKGIDITGTLRSSTGIPVNRGNVHISIADKNFYANAITNADGRFIFPNLVFPDSAKVVLSARDNIHASDLVLTVDGEQRQSIPINYDEPDGITNIDNELSVYLKNSKQQFNNLHILKEVVIKDKRIVKTTSHKDYGNLTSLGEQPDHVINGSQLEGCNTLLECIKPLAMGMEYIDNNFYVTRDYNAGKKTPTQVFVKGMPVDPSYLESVDPKMVESIEIFTKDELGLVNSTYNSNGAIVVNMRKMETTKISYQDLKALIGSRNEITLYPKGYEPIKTFYLPRYSGPRSNQPAQTDSRSTIYWNPNIETDQTGNASFEYFNADGRGTYRVTIEGIDKDGNLGRVVYRYEVK